MQFTLRSILTLALLVLSSLVPSTYGATTGLTQVRDVSRSELVHGAPGLSKRSRSRRKRCQPGGAGGNAGDRKPNENPNHPGVVNVEKLEYTVTPNRPQDTPTEKAYILSSEGGAEGNFRVSTSEGTVTIDHVDLDKDNRAREEKPMVYQVVMSLWVHTSMQEPGDLKSFYADNVIERTTAAFLGDALDRRAEEGLSTEEYSLASDSTGLEEELYNYFLTTSFGKNAVGMGAVPQFGKKLTRVDVSAGSGGSDDSYNMEFFYDPLPKDEPDDSAETGDQPGGPSARH